MEENQSFVKTQLEETEAHLLSAIAKLTESRAGSTPLMAYSTMLKLVETAKASVEQKHAKEDFISKLMREIGSP